MISGTSRGLRGGAWGYGSSAGLASSTRLDYDPSDENRYPIFGFRVASVPEPTSFVLTVLAGGMMLIRRRR